MDTATKPLILRTPSQKADFDLGIFTCAQERTDSRTIIIDEPDGQPKAWVSKQDLALQEYRKCQIDETIDRVTREQYKLFGNYIDSAIAGQVRNVSRPIALDIGCGIWRKLPLYMRNVHTDHSYVGLDAYSINLDRDYMFISGRLEALKNFSNFDGLFDVFTFGTSLDHFEDMDQVSQVIHKLAAPGAKAVFWIGLHDLHTVAAEAGAEMFQYIFSSATLLGMLGRALKVGLWKHPRMLVSLLRRRRKLSKGSPMDPYHFWYLTEENMTTVLEKFGEIVDTTYIPFTGSVFVTCRVSPPAD